jgi:hypothetical protein
MLSTLDAYNDTPEPDDEPLWQRLRELETQIEDGGPTILSGSRCNADTWSIRLAVDRTRPRSS